MVTPIDPHGAQRDGYLISTDPALLDLDAVHGFLTEAYWSQGISLGAVRRSIEHSLSFGLYDTAGGSRRQVGFARVITDYATFAYVCDVFVLPEFRGRGLATWLMEVMLAHPRLQGLRRWFLFTRDAHALYAKVGFAPLRAPERAMERFP